jgi:hypothetical protein
VSVSDYIRLWINEGFRKVHPQLSDKVNNDHTQSNNKLMIDRKGEELYHGKY